MSALHRTPSVRIALLVACIGLAGAHAPALATPDFPIAIQICPKEGRDPSSAYIKHGCGVWSPDDFATRPSWTELELMALDANAQGGGVVAKLQCMSRSTGAVSTVAVVQSKASGRAPTTTRARLPAPLDFSRCAYFVSIDADSSSAAVQALMVVLRN